MMFTYCAYQRILHTFCNHWTLEFSNLLKHFSQRLVTSTLQKNPGRIITSDVIALLVGEAWPQALTPLNIMGGFRKCGIYPLNPGAVTDRQLAPSLATTTLTHSQSDFTLTKGTAQRFSQEQVAISL